MSERRFQESLEKHEEVLSNLKDWGLNSEKDYKEVAGKVKIESEGIIDLKIFTYLFDYLDGEKRTPDKNKIESYSKTQDNIGRLKLLSDMNISDAVECVNNYATDENSHRYLTKRLEFYQTYIRENTTEEVPETVRLGLSRNILYAAMQGTPEMAGVKIATRWINTDLERRNKETIKSAVELFGYHSGIFHGTIGQWADLGVLYQQCLSQSQNRYKKEKLTDKEVEHKAVQLMARRLEGANEYNGVLEASTSPYKASFKEAVTVGQLGHRVMRQLGGMRAKIQETNLQNIERFIGKSGDNRYGSEKKRLDIDIKALKDFIEDNKSYHANHWQIKKDNGSENQIKGKEAADLMTKQKNSEALQRAERWHEKEKEKINRWFEKSNSKIAQYDDISEEERKTIFESVKSRYDEKIALLYYEYSNEIIRFQQRTPDQLLEELKKRQEIVDKRFQKRKSLAQKALDLHFHFNHEGGEEGSKPFNFINWINDAPFGVIKRAHRALKKGLDDQTIIMLAIAEIDGDRSGDIDPGKFVLDMAKTGKAHRVAQNFEKFTKITENDHLNVAIELVKAGAGYEVVNNFEKFTGIKPEDHLQIVRALNKAGEGTVVVENFEKFSGIPPELQKEIVFGAIKAGGGHQVAQNMGKFPSITITDHKDIVMEMIKAGNSWYLSGFLDKFQGLEESLKQVIKSGKAEALPYVLEAGFTIEEITRFPFLISPLVPKK